MISFGSLHVPGLSKLKTMLKPDKVTFEGKHVAETPIMLKASVSKDTVTFSGPLTGGSR